jgi:hypothetical protein
VHIQVATPEKPKELILPPVKKPEPVKSLKDIGRAMSVQKAAPLAIGFVYLRCPVCGETRGFNAKQELVQFHCNSCGSNSDMAQFNLVNLYSFCKCGRTWHYVTNMTDEMFDIPCLDCGNPVPVVFNAKSGAYETIRN